MHVLPEIHRDESCTQGLDWLELIRFLQVAQILTVHHGALGFLLGISALRGPLFSHQENHRRIWNA